MNYDVLEGILYKECSSYIGQLRQCNPGDILLRGFFGTLETFKKFNHNLENRKPLTTPQITHDLINTKFEKKFGWKIRNGVFCYGFNLLREDHPAELGYGPFYICFPVGEFKIVHSPSVIDLFGHISLDRRPIEKVLDTMDFLDNNLCSALNSGDRKYQNVSNEISIHVQSYFLVNYSYKLQVCKSIWGAI